MKRLAKWLANQIDAGDVIYVSGIALVAAGAWRFHPGAGLICGGIGAVFPFVVAMCRDVRPRKKD